MRARRFQSKAEDQGVDPFIGIPTHNSPSASDTAWFVYLLPLLDCSSFKVGFTCNPLQRIASFSRRFFERFDLHESCLLRVGDCEAARAVETALKTALAEHRCESPSWIPREAGGHTEWFSAVYFADAADRMSSLRTSYGDSEKIETAEFVRDALCRLSGPFERWAHHHAQRLCEDRGSVSLGYQPTVHASGLRDWVDAYRFFGVPLFAEDRESANFVAQAVQWRG